MKNKKVISFLVAALSSVTSSLAAGNNIKRKSRGGAQIVLKLD